MRDLLSHESASVGGGVDNVALALGGAATAGSGFVAGASSAGMAVTAVGAAAIAPVALVAIGAMAFGYGMYQLLSQ